MEYRQGRGQDCSSGAKPKRRRPDQGWVLGHREATPSPLDMGSVGTGFSGHRFWLGQVSVTDQVSDPVSVALARALLIKLLLGREYATL